MEGEYLVSYSPDALPGAWNFRDIAQETGIRSGLFFRSSELAKLDDAGATTLSDLGISDIADLRSDREVERRGSDAVPADVVVHRLPFREVGPEAPHEQGFEHMVKNAGDDDVAASAGRFMVEEYEKYPALAGAHAAVRQMITLLADGRPVITHCFAGKDRTGFSVAVVLEAIGVNREAIVADYLRSNDAVPELREQILTSIRERSVEKPTAEIVTFAEARLADEVLGVREEYLDAARAAMDAQFGSLPGFLDAIGVTKDQLDSVRSALR